MGEKIIVGPVQQGIRTDQEPFFIDNDSFPILINAYQWRGRVKRKRGTTALNRLERYFNSTLQPYTGPSPPYKITLDGSGNGNLLTGPYLNATMPPTSVALQANGNIIPGSVTIVGSTGPVTYTDPTMDGYLTPTGTGGPNTIDYATGAILIPAQAGSTVTAVFRYYPDLPVLGLEDLVMGANNFPGTLAFDPTYSYNILTSSPYNIYDVSFYKNPAAIFPYNYPSYLAKTVVTPTSWNGQDYQQYWSTNYEGAFWVTNGVTAPFTTTNIGMQYAPEASISFSAQTATTLTLVITNCPLVVGDFVFLNEFGASSAANAATLNFQSGYVISTSGTFASLTVEIKLPYANLATDTYTPGIVQYLTNRSDTTKDCIRWYDGDPTNGSVTAPVLNGHKGWVNFAPPFSVGSVFSIDDSPAVQYYLVGAQMILGFKDRLLFFGPVIQTSTANSQIYLQDTVIFSQNGTPYYTASFAGSLAALTSPKTVYNPILTPINQGAAASAYFSDVTGFGGDITAGVPQPITSVSPNEDVLIVSFSNKQSRFVFTGLDLIPFNFFTINSEYGCISSFSSITLDRGVYTVGNQGITITSQVASQRIDLEIPDQVFQFNLLNNGAQQITAQRDFINEWVYFTYKSNAFPSYVNFPNQTLQYNYRDNSWGIANESYTSYGQFRKSTGYTWQTIPYRTWNSWNVPWNGGASTLLQPQVIAGNQQGFVLIKDNGTTNETNSLYIQSFSGSIITSPDHGLNNGDYIVISGCLGTVGAQVNGKIWQVGSATENTFQILSTFIPGMYTYFGGGLIQRMYIPLIKTKQFPLAWSMSRKTRIGPQQYLFTRTNNGQIELQIFLSQDAGGPSNFGPVIPSLNVQNVALIYSDILYTCPESTNVGLTSVNSTLQH